ncbi:MAG: RNA polymerase-associated protein RapA [Candidatus Methanoperedenaceae archaeon GB50]|nr:MAG: RNA polymerase-associated protein RapA [Candidatus Methanoperedenaceae archaeon GB50]
MNKTITPGSILQGPFWQERIRVLSIKSIGMDKTKIEAVGITTNTFYPCILSQADLEKIKILPEQTIQFSGNSKGFFLFTEAHRMRNAFQFDPLYAVNVSQVDPLPHQIEAVYYYILRNPRIRFLLADDPGAGKTIMAGLLLKELKYRGLVERVLIVAPGHLKDQWLREMHEKFQENFFIVDRSAINAAWGQNIWQERNQVITSIDFAKQDDVLFSLKDVRWDLVIVDEAHKMSAYKYGDKISKTGRYKLGEGQRIPDEEAIKKIKEATMEALATRHIDLSRILGEQRKARENRLVPEYVEAFFKRAAEILDIKMEKRQDDFWRISQVPLSLRNQTYEFKTRFGEVNREYNKLSFDKEKAFKGQAEFIALGHPLLEAVIEKIFKEFALEAEKGALFFDPEGKRDGVIWFLVAGIKDGNNQPVGKRLFAAYQTKNDRMELINPGILWDLRPANEIVENIENIELDEDKVIVFIIETGLEAYRHELLVSRKHDAQIKQKYGIRSLDALILKSEEKLAEYEIRRAKGENIPEGVIARELHKKHDLECKKQRLLNEITAETHLLPETPKILGVARVIPESAIKDELKTDEEIEKIGMNIAMSYEKSQGRMPEDVSSLNLGYDIRSKDTQENYRYIEVKARAKEGAIALTPNEWIMAQRLGDEYWLYVVTNADSSAELYLIQNPAKHLKPDEEIDIVRYIVRDWKEKAVKG